MNMSGVTALSILIFAVLIGIWTWVAVLSYEFYSTGKYNRYRFRYWFIVGTLNIFHCVLGIFYLATNAPDLLEFRWLSFMLIDLLLFEIFIPKAPKKRSSELLLRLLFFIILIISYSPTSIGVTTVFISLILLALSYTAEYPKIAKHFRITFVLHLVVNTAPYFFGVSSVTSLLIGILYSVHVAFGVQLMYNEERCLSLVIDKLIYEERAKRFKQLL